MANPRKFSEKIALHNQKQAEETAAFEKIMREVSDATNKVNPTSRRASDKVTAESSIDNDPTTLRPLQGSFRSGSLPNVAAPQPTNTEQDEKPEDTPVPPQYAIAGGRSGGTSPSRNPVQRGRTSSSVGPMRRPADRKHDTSPYGSSVYLSPPPDSNWRRTNSDSALHQSCGSEQQGVNVPLSPHHQPHQQLHHPHQNHRRAADIHLDMLATLGMSPTNRPRSSCEIPRIPNDNKVYSGEGGEVSGAGGLCADMQVPGGSLPDLTSVYRPRYPHPQHHVYPHNYSPTSPGAVSPGAGSVSPATGGLSPASGSPVGATVPLAPQLHQHDHTQLFEAQNRLSVPNTNNYLHHNKNISPLEQSWVTTSYQSHCSPPSQYSSTSNINIPSPTMVHSPGSPVESPQTDYSNFHQAILQPFEQITMDWAQLVQSLVESGWTAHVQVAENLDHPSPSYNTSYINHSSPHTPQTTNSPHTYTQSSLSSEVGGSRGRDPVPGGAFSLQPLSSPAPPTTPPSIPDIILTDYSGELDAGIFGGEEAQLRAGLDLDDLSMLDDPNAMLPDSAVEHEFRLDRL